MSNKRAREYVEIDIWGLTDRAIDAMLEGTLETRQTMRRSPNGRTAIVKWVQANGRPVQLLPWAAVGVLTWADARALVAQWESQR